MKKYNYKYLIGIIIGILLCGGTVYARIMYSSAAISYDHSGSTLTSNNIQAAIDELAAKQAALTSCPSGKLCIAKKSTLVVGDYIRYVPNKTSYTTDTTKTGYTSAQTINPSELTLWRVLRINQDNTVDIISENVSSALVNFKGLIGYQNFVGYLNVLASQYENSTYTVGSRHFGYANQTEYITDTTYFTNPAPWTCSTGDTCSPDPDDYEIYGGGDTSYLADYNLVNNVLGTFIAKKAGAPTDYMDGYWMASRYYRYVSANGYFFAARYINNEGSNTNTDIYGYSDNSNGFGAYGTYGNYLRPIVTLKSTLTYDGLGTEEYPMEIVS